MKLALVQAATTAVRPGLLSDDRILSVAGGWMRGCPPRLARARETVGVKD